MEDNKQMLEEQFKVLRSQTKWAELYFYQKTDVLYQLTFIFTKQHLLQFGDRTVDQMVQAARSGKQNIVEGSEDGVTSMEMEIKLLNVARSSIHELREDYEDYLKSRELPLWDKTHPRYERMLKFCRNHNRWEDYEKLAAKMNAEEMANTALTLCHMVDKMMISYQKKLEKEFVTEGGIKERMTAARLGYRTNQQQEIARLRQELAQAQRRIAELEEELRRARGLG
jgi:four helix bundle suffix protein